jgi:protein-disulfide isomerase
VVALELRWSLLLAGALSAGCQTQSATRSPSAAASLITPAFSESGSIPEPSSPTLPVDLDDGVWGSAHAPVTVMVFTDLQCPYCLHGHASLVALEQRYGGARLRVVVKHVPLSGHAGAVPAARVAQAVLELGGRAAFFRYLDRAFAEQERVAAGQAVALAAELGFEPGKVVERAESAAIGAQVLADVQLADRIAVPATPHYRINGLSLTGVRTRAELERVVDAELAAAAALRATGVPAAEVYARRVQHNFPLPEPSPGR